MSIIYKYDDRDSGIWKDRKAIYTCNLEETIQLTVIQSRMFQIIMEEMPCHGHRENIN